MEVRSQATPAVLEATLDLFVERGFDGFSMADVALRTGGASNLREDDRLDLLTIAIDDAVPMLTPCPDLGSLRADLEAVVRWQIEMMQSHRRIINRSIEAALISAEYAEAARQISDRRIERYRPILEHAIARGEVAPSTDLSALELVFGPLWARFFDRRSLDESMIESVVESALHGFARPQPR